MNKQTAYNVAKVSSLTWSVDSKGYSKTGKWKVSVTLNGKSYHGGYFDKMFDAESASKELRERLHKSFSRMS